MTTEDRKLHVQIMNLIADARERRLLFWMRAMLLQARRVRENNQ